MSAATANAAIRGVLDRLAYGQEQILTAYVGGTDFWDRIDAAADETFENLVKGTVATALDAEVARGAVPTQLSNLLTDLDAYANTLGVTTPSGHQLLDAYLESYGGWRVPWYAAEAYYYTRGGRLQADRVFSKGVRPANEADPSESGMHKFGRFTPSTFTADAGALDTTRIVGAPILAINLGSGQTVGGTFRCTCQDGSSTKDLALSLSSAAQYTQTILGRQAIASPAAAGQKVVSVAATAQFSEGEYVLLWESDELQEIALVETITDDTSLTMAANLLNSFTTGGFVLPLFVNVTYQGGGSGSGNVDFFAMPDRAIAL